MNERKTSTNVAGILSLFVPGLGQLYKGKVGEGILWFLFTVIGYGACIVPGIVVHVFCILNAFKEEKESETPSQVYERLGREAKEYYTQHKEEIR